MVHNVSIDTESGQIITYCRFPEVNEVLSYASVRDWVPQFLEMAPENSYLARRAVERSRTFSNDLEHSRNARGDPLMYAKTEFINGTVRTKVVVSREIQGDINDQVSLTVKPDLTIIQETRTKCSFELSRKNLINYVRNEVETSTNVSAGFEIKLQWNIPSYSKVWNVRTEYNHR